MSQKHAAFYAVIVDKTPGVQNTRCVPLLSLYVHFSSSFFPSPFLPGKKCQSSWPIVFKCSTRQAADAIAVTHSLIDENISFDIDIDIADQAWLIWKSKVICNYESIYLKGPYYPVVYSGVSGSGSIVHNDLLNITSGTRLLSLSFFFFCHLFVLILLFVVDAYIIMLGKQIRNLFTSLNFVLKLRLTWVF